MRSTFIAVILVLAVAEITQVSAQSSGGAFSITRHVVGPSASSAGGAFAMSATVGQPVIGVSSAGAFQAQSGYEAGLSVDTIFSNGFEP